MVERLSDGVAEAEGGNKVSPSVVGCFLVFALACAALLPFSPLLSLLTCSFTMAVIANHHRSRIHTFLVSRQLMFHHNAYGSSQSAETKYHW